MKLINLITFIHLLAWSFDPQWSRAQNYVDNLCCFPRETEKTLLVILGDISWITCHIKTCLKINCLNLNTKKIFRARIVLFLWWFSSAQSLLLFLLSCASITGSCSLMWSQAVWLLSATFILNQPALTDRGYYSWLLLGQYFQSLVLKN